MLLVITWNILLVQSVRHYNFLSDSKLNVQLCGFWKCFLLSHNFVANNILNENSILSNGCHYPPLSHCSKNPGNWLISACVNARIVYGQWSLLWECRSILWGLWLRTDFGARCFFTLGMLESEALCMCGTWGKQCMHYASLMNIQKAVTMDACTMRQYLMPGSEVTSGFVHASQR